MAGDANRSALAFEDKFKEIVKDVRQAGEPVDQAGDH
jgi:hypothetical protein